VGDEDLELPEELMNKISAATIKDDSYYVVCF
jgi:hypothetical protein